MDDREEVSRGIRQERDLEVLVISENQLEHIGFCFSPSSRKIRLKRITKLPWTSSYATVLAPFAFNLRSQP